jgi:hemoglobin-like flavoprotein
MKHDANALVQASWKKGAAIAPQAAELFYAHLFNADPSLKPLFKTDMCAQGHKLMQTIGFAVDKLDDLETLVPTAKPGAAARGLWCARAAL